MRAGGVNSQFGGHTGAPTDLRLLALNIFSPDCGWPGALLVQQLVRHKSSKLGFRSTYWDTVALNVIGFVAGHSPWIGATIP